MPHSKGPFVVDDLDKSPARILQAGNHGHALALVYLTDPKTRKRSPEFVGNAHLFAASPALLAALKWAMERVKDDGSSHYAAAHEAIWAAEGRITLTNEGSAQ